MLFAKLPRAQSLAVLTVFVLSGCQQAAPAGNTTTSVPAHDESSLTKVMVTADQVKSMNLQAEQKPRKEKIQDTRRLNGWIQAAQGHEVTLTAPVPGYVMAGKDGQIPIVGYPVNKSAELLAIDPVLTSLEQIQLAALKRTIESDLRKAEESIKVAELDLKRTQEGVKDGIRTKQDLELAGAKLAIAKEDKAAALDKQKLFQQSTGKDSAKLPPKAVVSPLDAVVLTVHVNPGQYVAAAAPLVTICNYSQLWVRVPVPEYDLSRIAVDQPATVLLPGGAGQVLAKRKSMVPQVDPIRHTADVIYELPDGDAIRLLAKDQMLGVLLPLGKQTEESVVKYSAVVYDAYGGAWIYLERGIDTKSGLHVYERRRVEIGLAVGVDDVSIRPGLQDSDKVVHDGAAKLFSAEFFKTPILQPK